MKDLNLMEIDRVLQSTRTDGLHLIWTGKVVDGIPVVHGAGGTKTVRRHLWILGHTGEPIPKNNVVRTTCSVVNCVAPEHLELQSNGGYRAKPKTATEPSPAPKPMNRAPHCAKCGKSIGEIPAYLSGLGQVRCIECSTTPAVNSPEAMRIADCVAAGTAAHSVAHLPQAEIRRLRAGEATAARRKAEANGNGVPAPVVDAHAVETCIGVSRVADLEIRSDAFTDSAIAPVDGPDNGVGVVTGKEGSVVAPSPSESPIGARLFVAVTRSLLDAGVFAGDLLDLVVATDALRSHQARIEEVLR